MAPRNPMLECMQSGRTALGVWANDPETVELCAFLGIDWIMIDMKLTGMDFRDVQNMIRTCEAAGITPVVRTHSNPWLGYDHRIAVDLSRLQGIGAQFILVSHSGIREIEEALEVAKDWHRRARGSTPFGAAPNGTGGSMRCTRPPKSSRTPRASAPSKSWTRRWTFPA